MYDTLVRILSPFLSKPLLSAAIRGILLSTLVMVAVMIGHKLLVEHRERLAKRLRGRYLSFFLSHGIRPTPDQVRPTGRISCNSCADVAISLYSRVRRDESNRYREMLQGLGVIDRIRRDAVARSWIMRHKASEKLGFLLFPELAPFFRERLASEKDVNVRSKLIWALSRIAEPDDIPLINSFIDDTRFMSAKFNESIYCNIISAFRSRNEEDLCLDLLERCIMNDELHPLLRRDIIEACGAAAFFAANHLITAAYYRLNSLPEMKITCLRALANIGGDTSGTMTRSCLTDQDWRVRAVAAKGVQERHGSQTIQVLAELLGDQHYTVRLNAAVTLGTLGETGRVLLLQQADSSDRFARDVARFVLEGQ